MGTAMHQISQIRSYRFVEFYCVSHALINPKYNCNSIIQLYCFVKKQIFNPGYKPYWLLW